MGSDEGAMSLDQGLEAARQDILVGSNKAVGLDCRGFGVRLAIRPSIANGGSVGCPASTWRSEGPFEFGWIVLQSSCTDIPALVHLDNAPAWYAGACRSLPQDPSASCSFSWALRFSSCCSSFFVRPERSAT